jgi:Concanavalin A-like lectin/glucanases superfamily
MEAMGTREALLGAVGAAMVFAFAACSHDWDNLDPRLGATSAGGAGPGPGGAGPGSGGAAPGSGGSGGTGMGGSSVTSSSATGGAGTGGSVPALVDTDLVVRYFIDEAASGTNPQHLDDFAPAPLDLPLTYSAGLAYTAVAGNRGLKWAAPNTVGDGRIAIAGTKIVNALNGSTEGTIEAVVDVEAVNAGNTHITCIGPGGNAGGFSLIAAGPNAVRLVWHEGVNIGTWSVPITTSGRVVLHAVLDTGLSTSSARTRLYVNGQAATSSGGTPPAMSATIDLTPDIDFVIGNAVGTPLSIGGTIYYVAMYSGALSQQDIATNTQRLLASDDP